MWRLACIILLFGITSARADYDEKSIFFRQKLNDFWTVQGANKEGDQNNSICSAILESRNGFHFELVKDITDGELYMFIYNPDWNMEEDKDDKYKLRLNFFIDNRRLVYGDSFGWYRRSKNRLHIPNLNAKTMTDVFLKADTMRIIMPGDVPNTALAWPSKLLIPTLVKCLDAYDKQKQAPALVKGKGQI